MHPALSIPSPTISTIQIGPLVIHFYALCILAGIAIAIYLGSKRWKARGGQPGVIIDVALWSVPIGIVGARIFHVLTHWDYYFHAGADPLGPIKVWEGGLAIYGGLIFGVIAAWFATRASGARLMSVADALAPAILVAQAVGRLGNYFNQELFGQPTTLPWGLEIPATNPAYPVGFPAGILFHPTFLYEMLWNLLGFVLIVFVFEKRFNLRNGRGFAIYLIYYSIGRAFIESIRIDQSDYFFGIRTNVWSAIVTILVAMALFVWLNRTRPGTEPSVYLPGREPMVGLDDKGEGEASESSAAGSNSQDGLDFQYTAPEDQ